MSRIIELRCIEHRAVLNSVPFPDRLPLTLHYRIPRNIEQKVQYPEVRLG